jgi:hypothetical protein
MDAASTNICSALAAFANDQADIAEMLAAGHF